MLTTKPYICRLILFPQSIMLAKLEAASRSCYIASYYIPNGNMHMVLLNYFFMGIEILRMDQNCLTHISQGCFAGTGTVVSLFQCQVISYHDDVIKWEHFPRCWPFVRGIHRYLVTSPHKGQWREALMFSLICVWINGWVKNREAGDLRHYCALYYVIAK